MHWLDSLLWGWVKFYGDLLTTIGLIGLLACIIHGTATFYNWVWAKAEGRENDA